ncbi:single-stranded-DNA-specific exonuclease RecJ [Pseudomaricurvus alkylphenolicus]|uniref:single-stranded-DNA-specific exonuclease RecJ n=1 Tax=Pseudomaricurvus alkylphenolicus TaxID=1306991 RepID=UPI0014219471|nr:single-stranded-DNA-specific exonuclease RecJ [Pseudomaricurvus alkylphenolicus]NIB42995.1 single-stranded-DNA-specific exonuclease RecJ [Pseudomaricurvus alkylphenolicus]
MQTRITRRSIPDTDILWPHTLHPRLQRIYAARGITDINEIERSLGAMLRPQQLKGLNDAVALLVEALQDAQSILIVGDFDADGATSSALAVLALRDMGAHQVQYLVPNRFDFGYGLTPEIVEVARTRNPDLIITVDNGISSIDGVNAAKAAGIKVLVTDHHLPGAELPAADAVVNPNQPGCEFPSKNLAGVGVIFYLMSALRGALRQINWFQDNLLPEPKMGDYLDLVSLGTVADVVPLDNNNRILVHQGLQRIRSGRARPGILSLLEVAGRKRDRLVASDLGFAVGPRLNAAGRLDDMSLGIECLLCQSPELAREMAVELDELNRDRRAIEAGMQQEALQSLQTLTLGEDSDLPWGLCIYDGQWHQGVIGILASRIKERFHRPVIAFADANEEEIKGSARSIPGLHIRDALDAVASANPGLLTKFGGHAMAAGMSLKKSDFERFQKAFDEVVRRVLKPEQLQAEILSDGALSHDEINLPLAYTLRESGPWGQHFPEPIFDGSFYLVQQRLVGEKHLKMVLAVDDAKQQLVDAIAFNVDTDQWPNPAVQKLNLAYKLDVNEFRGRESLQLMVEYLEPVQSG